LRLGVVPAEVQGASLTMATSSPASPLPDDDSDATERRPAEIDLDATIRALRAGEVLLGSYRLEKFLGRGGMGVVWQARDESLGLSVALKFLPELVTADATGVEELKRETRRSLELTHTNIVRIHGFRQEGTHAAIAMELVEGLNLSELRKNEAAKVFTPAQVLPWLGQLCAALDYAHGERVVHRDLKPANLMLTHSGGRLKVMDFGISAALSETATRVSRVASSSGSPPYMSPQQMAGGKPGVADDVYSLGATLYEVLTGRPPFFRGNIYQQTQSAVPPPLGKRRAELLAEWVELGDFKAEVVAALPLIPLEWEATIAACLAKDAEDRPKSAGEVFRRLNGEINSTPAAKPVVAKVVAAKPVLAPTGGRGFSAVRSLALGLGAAVLGFGVWLSLRQKSDVPAPVVHVASPSPAPAFVAMATRNPTSALAESPPTLGTQNLSTTPANAAALEKSRGAVAGQAYENSLGMKFVPVAGTGFYSASGRHV
jgi:serine/threonine protein kinase